MSARLMRSFAVGLVVSSTLLAAPPAADAGRRNDALVREINARWQGARCRLLFDIPLTKKTDSGGWSKSVRIVPSQGREVRKGMTAALMWVSDRSAAPGGVVRAGTTFIADGWAFKKPKSREGIYLELRAEGSSARARFEPCGAWSQGLDDDDLPDIDRWVRMDILQVSAANERLVEVAAAPEEHPPTAASTSRAEPPPPTVVGLKVLGTATEPMTVAPGQSIDLAVTYEVTGVPAGREIEVLERRVILRDRNILTTLEATVLRGAGTHRSTQSLTVPASITPGVLELRARVVSGGAESSGETLFQVRTP